MLLEGRDLDELLAQVRAEHGPDAVVISAEKVRTGGVGGLFGTQKYELTIEIPDVVASSTEPSATPPDQADTPKRAISIEDLAALADEAERRGENPTAASAFAQLLAEAQQDPGVRPPTAADALNRLLGAEPNAPKPPDPAVPSVRPFRPTADHPVAKLGVRQVAPPSPPTAPGPARPSRPDAPTSTASPALPHDRATSHGLAPATVPTAANGATAGPGRATGGPVEPGPTTAAGAPARAAAAAAGAQAAAAAGAQAPAANGTAAARAEAAKAAPNGAPTTTSTQTPANGTPGPRGGAATTAANATAATTSTQATANGTPAARGARAEAARTVVGPARDAAATAIGPAEPASPTEPGSPTQPGFPTEPGFSTEPAAPPEPAAPAEFAIPTGPAAPAGSLFLAEPPPTSLPAGPFDAPPWPPRGGPAAAGRGVPRDERHHVVGQAANGRRQPRGLAGHRGYPAVPAAWGPPPLADSPLPPLPLPPPPLPRPSRAALLAERGPGSGAFPRGPVPPPPPWPGWARPTGSTWSPGPPGSSESSESPGPTRPPGMPRVPGPDAAAPRERADPMPDRSEPAQHRPSDSRQESPMPVEAATATVEKPRTPPASERLAAGAYAQPATAPAEATVLPRKLQSLGVPSDIAVQATGPDTYATIVEAFTALAVAEPAPDAPGETLVVVGESTHAMEVARFVAEAHRLDAGRILFAGRNAAAAGVDGKRRITGAHDARLWAKKLRKSDAASVVAVEAALDECDWAASIVEAVRPAAVWVVVDASRKTSDVAHHLQGLRRVDAICLRGTGSSGDPASPLSLRLPVALLDGRPSTPYQWAAMLCERLSLVGG
ncbi:hypothetical protein [Dactylosporangium sp. CA-092794]|uniref:hypothetical protein n=1 Tax=Dactylosporangium sp. CA-092794 TaxID=3239929 RepID=UPI003D8A674E